jgi:hypothetical protein
VIADAYGATLAGVGVPSAFVTKYRAISSCKTAKNRTYRGMGEDVAARRRPGRVATKSKMGIAITLLDTRQTVTGGSPYSASTEGNSDPAVAINPGWMNESMK